MLYTCTIDAIAEKDGRVGHLQRF